jgi:predicted P-loop ATPase
MDSKQVIERTTGKWIIEASELHGNRGREAEQLKAFLSRQIDGPVRLAYARLPISVPRQFVIIGTTNTSVGYLKDATGGRRFWPVRVQRFDVDAILRDRDQIWAEAAEREATGESIRLDSDLWEAAGQQQEQRRAADPWEDDIEELLEDPDVVELDGVPADAVSIGAIWARLGVEANHRDHRHADRVAAIVQRHRFTLKKKFRARTGGKPSWHWLRVPSRSEERAE